MKALLFLAFFCPLMAHAKTNDELLRELQVGSEWGKTVAAHAIRNLPSQLANAAHAVAEFKGGTAFLIQTNSHRVVFATNAHVMVNDNDVLAGDLSQYRTNPALACHERDSMDRPIEKLRLSLLGISGECKKVIGIWPEIDFALFEADFAGMSADELNVFALSVAAQPDLRFGQSLAMFGYGHFLNPGDPDLALMYIRDQDCQVFSQTNDFRFISDPDDYSPGKTKVWAFVLGCEVTWGDSGAPILDFATGQFAGIIFTGKYPKDPEISLNPRVMEQLRHAPDELVWRNLNFGVPAAMIQKIINERPWPDSSNLLN